MDTEYIRFIKLCYSAHDGAFRFYEDLLDYIDQSSTRHASSLQSPITYEVCQQRETKIFCFPFRQSDDCGPEATPKIITLKGFLSSDLISDLGHRFKIRPEIFIGHLAFNRLLSSDLPSYELPVLPSRRENAVHIRMISLVRCPSEYRTSTPLRDLRVRVREKCRKAEQDLRTERRYGTTRIRQVHVHSNQLYILEELVTMSIHAPETGEFGVGKWIGLFLLDNGSLPFDSQLIPWHDSQVGGRPVGTLPLIPYNSPIYPPNCNADRMGSRQLQAELDQLHPLKHVSIADAIDQELLIQDPFFLLASTSRMAMDSWSMLLNVVSDDIERCAAEGIDKLEMAVEDIRFNAALIDRVEDFIGDFEHILMAGGASSWPSVREGTLLERKKVMQTACAFDINAIRTRCKHLSHKCETVTTLLVNTAQLARAQKSIDQAHRVDSLTRLALIFIPAGLVASIFGMNVAEFKNLPPIGAYFAVAVPFTLMTFVAANAYKIRSALYRKAADIFVRRRQGFNNDRYQV